MHLGNLSILVYIFSFIEVKKTVHRAEVSKDFIKIYVRLLKYASSKQTYL